MDTDIWLPLATLVLGWAGAQVTEVLRTVAPPPENDWPGVPSCNGRRCWSYRKGSREYGEGFSEPWHSWG